MIKQKSVGIIIFRKEGKSIEYLLLRHHTGVYWKHPSGKVDESDEEDEMLTALRELEEETGLTKDDIVFLRDFREEVNYDFETEIRGGVKEKIHKTSVFFLAQSKTDKIKISNEHLDWGWFDYETALKRAFFQEQQDLLKKAHQFLLKREDILL